VCELFFFQAEGGIRDFCLSRGLGDVYKRQGEGYVSVAGNLTTKKAASQAMGIDWITNKRQLFEAIPPAYTEFIGLQLMKFLSTGTHEELFLWKPKVGIQHSLWEAT